MEGRSRTAVTALAVAILGAATSAILVRNRAQERSAAVDGGALEELPVPSLRDAAVSDKVHVPPSPDPASLTLPKPDGGRPTCAAPLVAVVDAPGMGGAWRETGCARPDGDGGPGAKEGAWILRMKDGRVMSGTYVSDHEDGPWTAWYPDGRMARSWTTKDGIADGPSVEWDPTGIRTAERNYKLGALDGISTITYPDGTIRREVWRGGHRIEETTE
ncbi:MAG: hypothetical protein U0169_21785 [Polyangiaceae bacterium]